MNEYLHPKNLNLVQLPTGLDTTIPGLRNPYLPKIQTLKSVINRNFKEKKA